MLKYAWKHCTNYNFYRRDISYIIFIKQISISRESLVFLPHVFIYKWSKDKVQLLNDLVNTYNVDGLECMHSEFSEEEITYLLNFAKKNNYYISGGSDYHGINKKDIEMAVGKGNLKITSDLIKNWIRI